MALGLFTHFHVLEPGLSLYFFIFFVYEKKREEKKKHQLTSKPIFSTMSFTT
jgi:hypothetical protein